MNIIVSARDILVDHGLVQAASEPGPTAGGRTNLTSIIRRLGYQAKDGETYEHHQLPNVASVLAAAEPQVPEPPGEQQWRRFCAVMAHKFPDRFKLHKSPEGSVAITDVRKCVDVNRRADGVALYANGRAVIGGLSLALQYTDPRIVEAASAFVRIQDAADRLYQAATDAMAGPMQEIQALLPEVKRKGNVVQRAVNTFRARVSKGFRESGALFREPVL